MASKATLKSIAQATGFSVTTVSRALAGYDDVNEDTRNLILSEARMQGYEPNLNAQLLQGQRSRTIGLMIPATESPAPDQFFSQFVAGVSRQAGASGYDLLLTTYFPDGDSVAPYRRVINRHRVDGMVLARVRQHDERIAYLKTTDCPFVVFGRTDDDDEYTYIDVDGISGQASLTRHFISLGHKRIAYAASPEEFTFTAYRMRGFRQAMQEAGLPVNERLIIHGPLTEHSGHAIAAQLLDLPDPPTAIMTGNDAMAFGVMRLIRERGLHVGSDIAVGGFDDVSASDYVQPELTTVRQPVYEVGQLLTNMLLQLIAGIQPTSRGILLEPEIIVRASSGAQRR